MEKCELPISSPNPLSMSRLVTSLLKALIRNELLVFVTFTAREFMTDVQLKPNF